MNPRSNALRGAILALTLTRTSPAQGTADSATSHPAVHGEALVFDVAQSRLVLFGGSTASDWLKGTWSWNGTRWVVLADSASSPQPRSGHALGYDPDRRRVMMFGGMSAPPVTRHCDTWIFAGQRWTRASADPCATERLVNTSLVYDARRRAMLLLEGAAVGRDSARKMRLWQWSERSWTLIDATGPRRVGYSAAAWDAKRSVLVVPVLFGGPDAGVWEWDGARWRHVPAASTGPTVRQTYGLTYDPSRERVVLMGGQGGFRGPYLDDAWEWTGDAWVSVTLPAGGPTGRGGATLHSDPAGRRLFYFGGYNTAPVPELWTLEGSGWHRINAR